MPQSYLYPLTVAGVGITLKTMEPLPVSERFQAFLSDTAVDGYLAEFREVPCLPEPEGPLVHKNERYEVYPDGAGGFARWYYDEMHGFVRFARRTEALASRRVLVEYIAPERELVTEMGNCFAFSGWEMLLLRERRLLLHAACVDTPCGGLLFSGPSGIGKSTQAGLWQKYAGARLINGDRPILQRTERGWLAWGSPYAGSSRWFVNESCPVRAIVMLDQAEQCSLRRLGMAEAFHAVFAGTTATSWDRACVLLDCELTEALIAEVPVYRLSCTPDAAAVELLRTELERGARP